MRAPHQSDAATPRDLREAALIAERDALLVTCWRQRHEIYALRETTDVLRAGAHRLAAQVMVLDGLLKVPPPAPAPHLPARGRSRTRCARTTRQG